MFDLLFPRRYNDNERYERKCSPRGKWTPSGTVTRSMIRLKYAYAILRFLQTDKRTTQPSLCFRSDSLGMAICGESRDANAIPVLITLLLQQQERITWTYLSDHGAGCDPRLRSQITAIYDDAHWKERLRGECGLWCRYDCWMSDRAVCRQDGRAWQRHGCLDRGRRYNRCGLGDLRWPWGGATADSRWCHVAVGDRWRNATIYPHKPQAHVGKQEHKRKSDTKEGHATT